MWGISLCAHFDPDIRQVTAMPVTNLGTLVPKYTMYTARNRDYKSEPPIQEALKHVVGDSVECTQATRAWSASGWGAAVPVPIIQKSDKSLR
jgi:hypothetical protein